MKPIITVENLSKHYQIGARRDVAATGERTLANTLRAPLKRLRRMTRATTETMWALKDINFEVRPGEIVGIIGRNGAGKSTLLKILSRITEPTTGCIKLYGRVGSLLEVGTGFHPELTGRENIYLNGTILGMKRQEIQRKFDEIVAFAEIDKFLDTPVKRYSSGMYVRLAFAVAAHLEPEILIVDEVLAVGDMRFQRKCLGKMDEVARGGRTVIFVSHNLGAISQLCAKALLLDNGCLRAYTDTQKVVQLYLQTTQTKALLDLRSFSGNLAETLNFERLTINDQSIQENIVISPSSKIKLKLIGECKNDLPAFRITFSLFKDGVRLLTLHDLSEPELLPKGHFESRVEIPALFLRPGEYSVAIGGYRDGMNEWLWGTDVTTFFITEEWGEEFDPINIGIVNLFHNGERRVL